MANKYADKSKANKKKEALLARKANGTVNGILHNSFYRNAEHSRNAEIAYAERKKPYNEWETRNFRNEAVRYMRVWGYDYDEKAYISDRMSEYGKFVLRRQLLRKTGEKHHVGKLYELVPFWEVDPEKLRDFIDKELANK